MSPMEEVSPGGVMKQLRERAGMTQDDAVKKTKEMFGKGVSRRTLCYVEAGKQQPFSRTIIRLCEAYGIPEDKIPGIIAQFDLAPTKSEDGKIVMVNISPATKIRIRDDLIERVMGVCRSRGLISQFTEAEEGQFRRTLSMTIEEAFRNMPKMVK